MVDPEHDGPILDELFTAGGMVDGIMIDAQAPPAEQDKEELPQLLKRLQDRLGE